MQAEAVEAIIDSIVARDPRYHRDAYHFLREALDYTQKAISKANQGKVRHITGQELLAGIRAFALAQYGPMTLALLQEWGVNRCEDFGEIVFNLVEQRVLRKTDTDTRADFAGGYDFDDAFAKPFRPRQRPNPQASQPP